MKFNKHLFLTASLILAFSAGMTSCGDDEESCSLKPADCKAEGKKLDRKACACIVDSCTKTCKDGQKLDEDSCTCVTIKKCDLTQADCEAQEKELDTAKCECVESGSSTCNIVCEDPHQVVNEKCECVDSFKCEKTCKEGEKLDEDKCECVPKPPKPNPNCTTENHPCDANQELDTQKCECVPTGEAECKVECNANEILVPDLCVCTGNPGSECDIDTCPDENQIIDPISCTCIDPSEPPKCTKTQSDCESDETLDTSICQCVPSNEVCTLECDSNKHQIVNKSKTPCFCDCEGGYIMVGNECEPVETCGNGKLDKGEFCDTTSLGFPIYANDGDADCKKWKSGEYESGGKPGCNDKCDGYGGEGTCELKGQKKCGNNVLDPLEFCDIVDGVAKFRNPEDAVCSEERGYDPKAGGTPGCNISKGCAFDAGSCKIMDITSIVQGFRSCSATFEYDSASNTVNATATYETVNPNPNIIGIVVCDILDADVRMAISKYGKDDVYVSGTDTTISYSYKVSNPPSGTPLSSGEHTCFFYIMDLTYNTADGRGVVCADKAYAPRKNIPMSDINTTTYFSI